MTKLVYPDNVPTNIKCSMETLTKNAAVDSLSDQELLSQGYRRANMIIAQMMESLSPDDYTILRMYPPIDRKLLARNEFEMARRVFFARDNYTCIYCSKSMDRDAGLILHVDHVRPICKGGVDTAQNLVTACQFCNCSKGGKELSAKKFAWVVEEIKRRNALLEIPNTRLYPGISMYRKPRYLITQ